MYTYKIYDNYLASDISFFQLLEYSPKENETPGIVLSYEKMPEDILKKVYEEKKLSEVSKERIWFHNQYGYFLVEKGKYIKVFLKDKGERLAIRDFLGDKSEDLDDAFEELKNKSLEEVLKSPCIEKIYPFILGYCMAMVFWQRDMVAIHCSAVEIEGQAVLIAGGSGSGKSTLTSRFLEKGARLLSDDLVVLQWDEDTVYALPAFPQQKLCRDAAIRQNNDLKDLRYIDEDKDKFAVSVRDKFYDKKLPLKLMVNLQPHDEIRKVQSYFVKGHEKLLLLIHNHFLKPVFDAEDAFKPQDMALAMKIASKIEMVRMFRPRQGDSTKEQYKIIMDALNNL
ncbi:hypothetical protein SAMN05216249_11265 [Acetitomaculum ruminis DSM 5522]|uniref:HPr Serine kinase C-terminal domain-containing protein n=1 Tax=Acetitomaculum ruminis DSM 5522 TaxID=1120918 RepID=A0A1I0Z169_9FIRM|nr:hypothetical protein [Acetitomaculum ruminis]SFB19375.1 hypothetical protein SAMN05216249_11265 [Acetitomaculum ruminis DSM 5522]